MKTNKTKLLLFFLTICTSVSSQVRPDLITDFNSTQRTTLVNLMQQYITAQIVEYHCDYVAQGGESDIHDDFNFMPFHRVYIEGMEDYFMLSGHPEFVPLPAWDPSTPTPTEFQVVDADCMATVCNNGVGAGIPSQYCNNSIDWNPNQLRPNYLDLPVQSGSNNDICDHNFQPTTPGGSSSSGLSRQLETPYHNGVHGAMGGNMGNFSSPASPIFWCWHAFLDDMWKEWECTCPQSTTNNIDLYLKDNVYVMQNYRDRGEEPNIDTGPMWRSQDIWVRNQQDGLTNETHENPEFSPTNPVYVYARVRNRGCQPSTGNETLSLNWAKAATALSWPNHWDGSITSPALMGDLIGTQNIPVVQPQSSVIVEFQWFPPNPADYNGINNEPWHFCLLARQVSTVDPMTFPEGANLNTNVRNNNNIAWKNITVVDDQLNLFAGSIIHIGNLNDFTINQTLEINLDKHQTFAARKLINHLVLKVDEKLWERLIKNEFEIKGIKPLDNKGEFLVTGFPVIINDIKLAEKENRQISIEVRNFKNLQFRQPINLNVIQRTQDQNEIVGGVTYVINTKKPTGEDRKPNTDLTPLTYGGKSYYNWYDSKGNIITTSSDFGYPKELDNNFDSSIKRFTSVEKFSTLKAKTIKLNQRGFFRRIFCKKKSQIIDASLPKNQLTSDNGALGNNKYIEIMLPTIRKELMVVMVFNPYCEIVNNYLIEPGQPSVSIRENNFCMGENYIYLVSGKDVLGAGYIGVKANK